MTSSRTAQGLASLGRNGDTMLMHVSPSEVGGLKKVGDSLGIKMTTNPYTGMPEAFNFGDFFTSFLPTIAGIAAAPATGGFSMAPILAGAGTGAALAAAKGQDPLMGGLTGGLGGYGGGQLAPTFGSMSTAGSNAITNKVATDAAYKGSLGGMQAVTQPGGYAGITSNLGPALTPEVSATIANPMGVNAATPSFGSQMLSQAQTNLGNTVSAGKDFLSSPSTAYKAFTDAGGNAMDLAMPVGTAVLSGMEPPTYAGYQDPDKDKYRGPQGQLNLSDKFDTGLRLVAEGGYIDGYATGGTIQSGGIRDLYGTPDNQPTISPGLSGFGLGRLNNLAGEQALNQAQTLGYAMGGPVSFADGGDSNKQTLELPSLDTDAGPTTKVMNLGNIGFGQGLVRNLAENMRSAVVQGEIPDQTNDSLITKVATNLKTDPNYKPANPLEEAIVNQLRGSNTMQGTNTSTQGLGSLKPSQPMTPTYNASQPMTPTYYAGMNAPKGYAEGGETSMNLDELPTLNVETGKQSYNTLQSALENSDNPQGRLLNKFFSFRPSGGQSIYDQFAAQGLKRLNTSGMARGGYLNGAGDGMSDSIPATIEGKQPARLADGEFVVPADVVSHLGNGSSKAGSKKLYAMMDKIRHARTGTKKQGKQINADKYLPKVA